MMTFCTLESLLNGRSINSSATYVDNSHLVTIPPSSSSSTSGSPLPAYDSLILVVLPDPPPTSFGSSFAALLNVEVCSAFLL